MISGPAMRKIRFSKQAEAYKRDGMSNVMIIDDDPSICSALSIMVKQIGHKVESAGTIASGLEKAKSGKYDAILLDVQLPDGDGLSLLPKLRDLKYSPEVIMMTAFGDQESAEIAIKHGAWNYVQKTGSMDNLIALLKQVLEYRDDSGNGEDQEVGLNFDGIVGRSRLMKSCYNLLPQAAGSDINVLIIGETGTGKELFARAIHSNSARSENNFVVVDCAALPGTLAESLLFGHRKGTFTSASETRQGLVARAHGGTLFLDEVGELPLSVQKVFLRVLQEKRFRPVGGVNEVESDFHLVAATNRDLDRMVQMGDFRDDLLFRIRSLTINLPALRDRRDDITDIADYHLKKMCERLNLKLKKLDPELLRALSSYDWPGNVRELIKVLEVGLLNSDDHPKLSFRDLPDYIRIRIAKSAVKEALNQEKTPAPRASSGSGRMPTLKEYRQKAVAQAEIEYLNELLKLTRGDTRAALEISGLSKSRFYGLIKQHGLVGNPRD